MHYNSEFFQKKQIKTLTNPQKPLFEPFHYQQSANLRQNQKISADIIRILPAFARICQHRKFFRKSGV
jgi:hypothetical protein